MRRRLGGTTFGAAVAVVLLAACGASPAASVHSPTASAPTTSASPSAGATASPSSSDIRLVIEDVQGNQVRLARLDARDTAKVAGSYQGIVNDHVILLNGRILESLDRSGTVRKLGQLAPSLSGFDNGRVAVSPDLSRWIYTLTDSEFTTHIHLGTPTSDSEIAAVPAPARDTSYAGFTWNASGVYLTQQPTGLGGAGPFLEYRFSLAKFDLNSHKVTIVSPTCTVYAVLDDGTMICRRSFADGRIDVRSPAGQTHFIQMTIGGPANTTDAFAYVKVAVSADNKRLIVGRNGAKDPVINYQMAVADLTSSAAGAFGPIDYLPDAWLPDGRVVGTHVCAYVDWGGGPCNASLDGTYFFSADGSSRTLFFKLTHGAVVGYL